MQDDSMQVLRIGHRGAAGHAPENTLASIHKAIALGVDLVEVDVRLTRDDHLVLLHDERVERTTNGRGAVAEMTLAAVRRLDAGRGEGIPTLEEVIEITSGRVGLILELKANGLAGPVWEAIGRSGLTGVVMYASFVHEEVFQVRKIDPGAMTMALFDQLPKDPASVAQNVKATHVGFRHRTVTESLVEACHKVQLQMCVYTVNEPQDIRKIRALGVDEIISDFPDRL